MSIKISEYTTEQTTILDDDKQELSTETAPGVWETRWYKTTTLYAKIKAMIFGDFIETTLGTTDSKVPTSKAVSDAISGVPIPTLQEVTTAGSTTTDAVTLGPLQISQGSELVEFATNGQIIATPDTGTPSVKTTLIFNNATANNSIQFQDGSGTVAFLSDIGSGAVASVTGNIVDNTDPANPVASLTQSNVHAFVDSLTALTTLVDADKLMAIDNSASIAKKITFANFKATLKTYFDTIYTTTSAVATQITTALSGYATQAWVTSQGYITNVISALGYTPLNPSNNLSDVSNTTTARTNLGFDTLNAVLAETATDGTATSSTANTYSTGVLITPAQINADTTIEVVYGFRKTGTAGNTTLRFYANATNDLSGSPILIGQAVYTAAQLNSAQSRFLRIKVKNGTGAGTEVLNTSINGIFNDFANISSAVSNLAIDWTSNKYIVAAIQAGSASDAIRINFLKVRR